MCMAHTYVHVLYSTFTMCITSTRSCFSLYIIIIIIWFILCEWHNHLHVYFWGTRVSLSGNASITFCAIYYGPSSTVVSDKSEDTGIPSCRECVCWESPELPSLHSLWDPPEPQEAVSSPSLPQGDHHLPLCFHRIHGCPRASCCWHMVGVCGESAVTVPCTLCGVLAVEMLLTSLM